MAPRGGAGVEPLGLGRVLRHPVARFVETGEVVQRLGVVLRGGAPEQFQGLAWIVLESVSPVGRVDRQETLCVGVAPLGVGAREGNDLVVVHLLTRHVNLQLR